MTNRDRIVEPAGQVPIVRRADLVVVGGGPAGIAAAVAGARNGLSVTLLERYAYLGGLASGGMVLVLDDMCNGAEISVRGICSEMVERMERHRPLRRAAGIRAPLRRGPVAQMVALGRLRLSFARQARSRSATPPPSTPTASSAHPTPWSAKPKVDVRLHSWFSRAIVEDGHITGVVCETKSGRQAIMGRIVVDATGDLDVAASAGAPFTHGAYMVTTVFRLGGVDDGRRPSGSNTKSPAPSARSIAKPRGIIGGSWDKWWLKTPLPGIVWCNCPHMTGLDGIEVEDLTSADFQGRERIAALVAYVARKAARVSRRPSSSTSRRRSACARRGCWTASM